MTEKRYDRGREDVGNIMALEHVNVQAPDQQLAMRFYVSGMGFTRDPYLMVGPENMWINVGQQQFHLPTRKPQVLRGHMGVVLPDISALLTRLEAVQPSLAGTAFSFHKADGHVAVTCPWGNQLRCRLPDPGGEGMSLGIRYVEFAVPQGAAAGIGRFYQEVMRAPTTLLEDGEGAAMRVGVGSHQSLIFREARGPIPAYDGHHIAVYLAAFSGPYELLKRRGLVTEESSAHQYRFQEIVDPATGESLFTLEHEVRSMRHPMYQRELVNRNPAQTQAGYGRGRDRV
jgi:hypothetical protein